MSRIRITAGLVAVLIGTAWWGRALPAVGESALIVAPYLLVVLAVIGAVRVMAPAGALAGPAVLLVVGAGWLALRHGLAPGLDAPTVLGAALILGGCAMALSDPGSRWRPGLTRRHLTILWRRRLTIEGPAPARLGITAVLGDVIVELTRADFPGGVHALEIDVTVLGGRVEITLPPTWKVGPGRIVERALRLDGELDWVTPVLSPDGLSAELRAGLPVVVNVVGFLGAVALPERPAATR